MSRIPQRPDRTGALESFGGDTDDRTPARCDMCRTRAPRPGYGWCRSCVDDLLDQLARRRAAALRLPPLVVAS